jgi:pimeloyl-ACP methyl ester carboxylesterase
MTRPRRWRFGKRTKFLAGALGGVAALLATGLVFDRVSEARTFARYPPPGRIVDAGTAKLHMFCTGPAGRPTIILEAGGGDISTVWRKVQPRLANAYRVCSYDRAGQGWSGTSSALRSPEAIASELHRALEAASERAPYLLVGHSLGGLYARAFAQIYPSDTIGLVLIDSSVDGLDGAPAPPLVDVEGLRLAGLLRPFVRFGLARLLMSTDGTGRDPAARAEAALRPKASAILATYDGLALVRSGHSGPRPAPGVLGARPVVVVTSRGPLKGLDQLPKRLRADALRYRPAYQAAQTGFTRLSHCSVQIFADRSGHDVHLDQPDLATSAIMLAATAATADDNCGLPQGVAGTQTVMGSR